MKKKMRAGILAMVCVSLLAACSAGSGEDAVSLEPHSMEMDAAGTGGTESGSAANGIGGNQALAGIGTSEPGASSSGSSTASGQDGIVSGAGTASDQGTTASGAGTASGQGTTASGAGTASGQGTIISGAGSGTQSSAVGGSTGTYKELYLQKINENKSTAEMYSLIYLDADEIPELVIGTEDGGYSIYTVKDQKLFCMADSLYSVELTYFERCGVIAGFDRWNGGGDEGGYGSSYYQVSGDRTLTNDDQSVLSYSYNAVYNDKGEYTGTGVTDYYYMGQQIDEAAYKEKMAGMGIAEGEDRLCMENIFGREEIPDLLK